jgi:hypothetical protein
MVCKTGFLKLLFFTFIAFYASGNDILHKKSGDKYKKVLIIKESLKKNPDFPFNYDLILNNAPVQVLNIQQHRVIHFSHGVNNRLSTCTVTVSYLNFICGQGNSELSHFRRLILFPFHAFW